MDGVRGGSKQLGEIRCSQNWISGTRPGNAVFVLPLSNRVGDLLADLKHLIHDEQSPLLPLVKIALAHVQFETIHPFLDGNGRMGRVLIAALLEHWNFLPEPLMYLSGYLKAHQMTYYQRLSNIRTHGDWESWIRFLLECVVDAASDAESSVLGLASLVAADRQRLLA